MIANAEVPASPRAIHAAMILIVLAYIMSYILPLGIRPLSTPDETRYGEIPHEMITTGDWAVPHLVGLRYFEKPPLGYWLNAVSLKLFGENNFAVRFPTALTAGLSAWFVWLLLIRLGYPQTRALSAAAIYLGLTEILIVGTIAVLDTPFTFFITAGMVLFYLYAHDPERRRKNYYMVACGVAFGLAFLTKGFLAVVLPGMILFVYTLLQKRYDLLGKSLIMAVIAVLTVLPWGIIIHLREPDFWRYFVVEEHIRRFLEPNAQHPEPFYFFIMYLPALAFPWVAYLPAAISGLRQRSLNPDLLRYLVLWFLLPLLFFSVSRGKLLTYVLPIFAPFAMLIAVGVLDYLKAGKSRLFLLGALINTALMILVLAITLHHQYYEPNNILFSANEAHKMHLLIAAIAVTALLCLIPALLRSVYGRLGVIILTVVPLFAFITLIVPHSTLAGLSPISIIRQEKHLITPDTRLISDANVVRAVAWELKRTDIDLFQKGELTYGLRYQDAKDRFLEPPDLDRLLQKLDSGEFNHPIAVFCEEPCPRVRD
ncbi:MAG: phospholipid carrier-dependent glycosyltransferase, partial [Gammaproteobacteria bacterium]